MIFFFFKHDADKNVVFNLNRFWNLSSRFSIDQFRVYIHVARVENSNNVPDTFEAQKLTEQDELVP